MKQPHHKVISKFWFFPLSLPLKAITDQEKKWSYELSNNRKYEFHHSRSYTRIALSIIFDCDPLLIPLNAPPGKAPILKKGFGFLSMSHCNDGFFLGWSNSEIGVDIESLNRRVDSKKISLYLFSEEEKEFLNYGENELLNEKFLSIWVMKEALVKYSKGNLLRDFKSWKIDFLNKTASNDNQVLNIFSNYFKYKSWMIGIASKEEITEIPNIINIY